MIPLCFTQIAAEENDLLTLDSNPLARISDLGHLPRPMRNYIDFVGFAIAFSKNLLVVILMDNSRTGLPGDLPENKLLFRTAASHGRCEALSPRVDLPSYSVKEGPRRSHWAAARTYRPNSC